MRIFDGKKEAEKILLSLNKKIKGGAQPKLAVIAVAPDTASKLYIRNKKRAARKVGISVSYFELKKEEDVIDKIHKLNSDSLVNGIIVQLPLPKNFNTDRIVQSISPKKDVDGFQKKSTFTPVLPAAILIALKRADKNIKKATALVNSRIFGETLKYFLSKEGIKINYVLKDYIDKLPLVDILITVCGCPGFIRGDMIKKEAVLIDAGITMKNGKVFGDVDRESVAGKAAYLTPVPGGIGPLTVALLLKNTYIAFKKY